MNRVTKSNSIKRDTSYKFLERIFQHLHFLWIEVYSIRGLQYCQKCYKPFQMRNWLHKMKSTREQPLQGMDGPFQAISI